MSYQSQDTYDNSSIQPDCKQFIIRNFSSINERQDQYCQNLNAPFHEKPYSYCIHCEKIYCFRCAFSHILENSISHNSETSFVNISFCREKCNLCQEKLNEEMNIIKNSFSDKTDTSPYEKTFQDLLESVKKFNEKLVQFQIYLENIIKEIKKESSDNEQKLNNLTINIEKFQTRLNNIKNNYMQFTDDNVKSGEILPQFFKEMYFYMMDYQQYSDNIENEKNNNYGAGTIKNSNIKTIAEGRNKKLIEPINKITEFIELINNNNQ